MNEKFVLTAMLRLFLSIGSNYRVLTLGDRLPVSIRKRYSYSQTIVIYPESDYDFFLSNEVTCYLSLAKSLNLDASISVENGVPVIEISDYNVDKKSYV